MNIPEQWKKVKDAPFMVSDQGRIKRVYKRSERILKGMAKKSANKKRSPQIQIRINGVCRNLKDVVWETFKGPKPKGMCVVHKNRLWRDNSVYNLELITKSELGHRFGGKVKSRRYIINLDTGKISYGTKPAGRDNYCSYQTIVDICNGKVKNPCVNVAWFDKENEKAYRGEYRYETE